MHKTPLIAAALLVSSAASAQVYGAGCRGDTISDLSRCAAERAPAPVEESLSEPGEEAPQNPQGAQPSNLGGALEPTNLRTNPPVVGRPSSPALAADTMPSGVGSFDALSGLGNNPTSPFYGRGRSSVERQRIFDPLAGTGMGTDR